MYFFMREGLLSAKINYLPFQWIWGLYLRIDL